MNSSIVERPITSTPLLSRVAETEQRLSALSAVELRNVIVEAMGTTVDSIVKMSVAVKLLEARGEDLSELPISMLGLLRRVGYGQLLPALVAKYFQSPSLLGRVARLPMPDQERLAEQDGVDVAFIDGEGRIDRRRVPLATMSPSEVRQVFSRDGIRDEASQVSFVRSRDLIPDRKLKSPPVQFSSSLVDAGDPIRSALNEALNRHGWSVAELCRKARVGDATAGNYLAGRSEIRSGNLVKLMRAAGINLTVK